MGIAQARLSLDSGEISSRELTQRYLDQIQGLNGALNAFLDVYSDEALEAADRSDQRRLDGGALSPMDGIPIALKDNLMLQGKRCTAGSKILANYIASYDATVVRKLKEAGSVFLGKTNMDEFAMGSTCESSAFGPAKNPRDPERVPGGSSGGSGVAVAADLCTAALGSDTGGSVRLPASFCGCVGLKPTYGRVSRSGLIAMASSLDQIGPMTKSVEDAGLLLTAIQGKDAKDQTTAGVAPYKPSWPETLSGLRVGLPRQAWDTDGMDARVKQQCQEAVDQMKRAGAELVEMDLPYADESLAVYYVLMPCEVSANLARFDGMRYGLRKEALPLFETYAQSRTEGFGEEVRRRILIGTFSLSSGYIDAYYLQAKKVQTLIRRAYQSAFAQADIIVTPTAPETAYRLGEKTKDPLSMYLGDIFTVSANVSGLPAISIPVQTDGGMPIGLQMIGPWFDEDRLLSSASVLEGLVSSA